MGRFVLVENLFFTVALQPKKIQSVCEDIFDRILVFENLLDMVTQSTYYTFFNVYYQYFNVQLFVIPRSQEIGNS